MWAQVLNRTRNFLLAILLIKLIKLRSKIKALWGDMIISINILDDNVCNLILYVEEIKG